MIKIPKMLSASLLNASSVPKLWGVLLLILGIVLILSLIHIFSKTGAKTVVLTDPHADLERCADGTDVLVIDAETRHISPQQAKE